MAIATGLAQRKSLVDRLMGLAAEVHPGEAGTALLLSLNVFILLAAYYVIKPVREALILAGARGAEIKSYAGAILAALFLFIVPAYSAFAGKVNRLRLINGVSLFFISNLVVFYLLSKASVSLAVPFYLWVSIFNLMVIAQFWAFANDIYTPGEGKRLFPVVGIGSTVGAVAGAEVAELLIKSIGLFSMMLVSAGMLMISLLLTNLIHNRERGRLQDIHRRKEAEEPLGGDGGFQLVLRHRYLLLIGLLTLTINWINTNGEFILSGTVKHMAQIAATRQGISEQEVIGGFYANFQFWQNLCAALMQFFLVSRILKYVGVRWSLFIMPVISLFGYSLLAAAPILAYIRIAKIAENSTDYSVQKTVQQALFLPTSRGAKYKAKQAVDTFFWRTGDMLSGLSVFVSVGLLQLSVRHLAVFNLGLIVIWLLVAAGIARQHRKLLPVAVNSSHKEQGI